MLYLRKWISFVRQKNLGHKQSKSEIFIHVEFVFKFSKATYNKSVYKHQVQKEKRPSAFSFDNKNVLYCSSPLGAEQLDSIISLETMYLIWSLDLSKCTGKICLPGFAVVDLNHHYQLSDGEVIIYCKILKYI